MERRSAVAAPTVDDVLAAGRAYEADDDVPLVEVQAEKELGGLRVAGHQFEADVMVRG